MANTILTEDWLAVIQEEYLQRFIKLGGAAVKFAVLPEEPRCMELVSSLGKLAEAENYCFAPVDVATTRAHMIDKMFFAIAHQIPWDDLTWSFLKSTLRSKDYYIPEDQSLSIEALASANGLEIKEMRRSINSWLENTLLRDHRMTMEFRIAMVRLCQFLLEPQDTIPGETDAVKQWLCGELSLISTLKKAFIFQKIARHNARDMVCSLCHWVHMAGKAGLIVTIDISQYSKPRGYSTSGRPLYYRLAAILDGYEVLRQFIDSTDELEFCLVVVAAPLGFLDIDRSGRGVIRYDALYSRIVDEVHDQNQANPLSSLVRLGKVGAYSQHSAAYEGLL